MRDHFRRQIFVSVTVILGGVVVLGLSLYFLSLNLDSEGAKVIFSKTAIATKATALESLANLKNDASVAQEYEQAMNKILVSQDQLINFPNWLDRLAHVRQVSASFSFQGGQVSPGAATPGYIGFTVNAAGPLSNLTDFFKDVEYREPQFLTSLDSFDINRSGSGYSVTVNGRVFFK